MLLYRYFGSHVFETLKEVKLKTARITSFNDPFEFLFIMKGRITAKKANEYVKSRLNNPDFILIAANFIPGLINSPNPKKVIKDNVPFLVSRLVAQSDTAVQIPFQNREEMADRSTRVISFSHPETEPQNEILLWSHYAKMHGGFRIGFEFPDDIKHPFQIFKVIYQDKRVEIDFSELLLNMQVGQALVESAKVKSLAWKYENEYRLFTHPSWCEEKPVANSKIECFLTFEKKWLRSVDFGVRCPETEIQRVVSLVKEAYPKNVLLRKSVFHKTEYALEYETIL